MSENETGIVAYDLEPPLMPGGLGYRMTPRFLPLRDRGEQSPMPRYVPLPQPEGTVRVVLESAGCDGEPADFRLYDDYPTLVQPYRVFDVPAEDYKRWATAREAFGAMQEEIEKLISDHARNPLPAPSPGLPF